MRIYISGKITGLPEAVARMNFEAAEADILDRYERFKPVPVNPFKITHKEKAEWRDYMANDIRELLNCDAVYMLKNWEQSRGARIEYAIAKELQLPFFFQ